MNKHLKVALFGYEEMREYHREWSIFALVPGGGYHKQSKASPLLSLCPNDQTQAKSTGKDTYMSLGWHVVLTVDVKHLAGCVGVHRQVRPCRR